MRRRRLWYLVLIILLNALLLTMARPANQRVVSGKWEHVNRTCRAQDCNGAINYEQLLAIESHMNTSADPCESFHNYACGNWRRENPLGTTTMMKGNDQLTVRYTNLFEGWAIQRELEEQAGVIELVTRRSLAERDELQERKQLAEIREVTRDDFKSEPYIRQADQEQLSQPKRGTSDWRPFDDLILQKMLKYYRVCKAQNNVSRPSLRAYYEATRPRLNWSQPDYNWIDTLASIGRYGYSGHFLKMNVVQKNVSVHRVVIYPHEVETSLIIDTEMYGVLRDLTNQPHAMLQQRFRVLESDLQNLSCQYCEQIDEEEEDDIEECDCYRWESMTFSNLLAELPEIDWQRFLSPQIGRQLHAHDIVEVVSRDLIKLQLGYIQKIDAELNMLYTLARFLNYIREQGLQLKRFDSPKLNCIHHMRKVFNMPLNYLYERAYYSSIRTDSQRIVEEVFEELKIQFELIIRNNKMQFSDQIIQRLLSKLKHIDINVGNLPKNVSIQFYNDYIEPYNFNENFPHNHMHAMEVFYSHYNALMDVSEQELQHTWHSFELHHPNFLDALDASPYYNARTNLIVITFSYLQLPFYDASFWPAFIYGDLASTLGHELIHAFDTEFLKFDENGNPSPQPLTNMLLNRNFQRNFVCLQRGTVFERERMADVSGARLALNTFLNLDQHALERNGELYFLQFSQFFCGASNQGYGHYDVDSLRLDYVVGALPEFASIFNCPLGSPMNPHKKCEMYT